MMDFIKRHFPRRLTIRFVIVGGGAALVSIGLLYFLVSICGLHYMAGGVVSWAIATYLAYVGNSGWTFNSFLGTRGAAKFIFSRAGTTVIGFCLYVVFVETGIWYLIAPMMSTAVVTGGNFFIARYWVWHQ